MLVAGVIYGDFFVVLLIIIKPYCGIDVRVELLGCEGVVVVGVYSHLLAYGVVEGVVVPGGKGGRRWWGVESSAVSMEIFTYLAWLEG